MTWWKKTKKRERNRRGKIRAREKKEAKEL